MKLASVHLALAHWAALGIVFAGAPLRAAGPVDGVPPETESSRFATDSAVDAWRDLGNVIHPVAIAADRDSKGPSYVFNVAIPSPINVKLETHVGKKLSLKAAVRSSSDAWKRRGAGAAMDAGSEWSPGIANWSRFETGFFGSRLQHLNVSRGVPLTLLGHVVFSRLTFIRNRPRVYLATSF